jgi:undecaprenyl-diphosphatase
LPDIADTGAGVATAKPAFPLECGVSVNEGLIGLVDPVCFPGRELLVDSLNHALFLAFNASSDPSWPVVLLAIIAAKYLVALVPLHIALVWSGGTRAMRFLAITALVALGVALAANQIIGFVAYTPRPFLIGIGHTLIDHRPSFSFPSNHGTVFFTYAIILGLFGARGLAWMVAGLGLLVAWSRIYLGVHFPFDMLGALLVSACASFASLQFMLRFCTRMFGRLDDWALRLLPLRG